MFDKQKYLTRGVDADIPLYIQLMMWQAIEQARKKTNLDYLQVFRLSQKIHDGKLIQIIRHTQERPAHGQTISFYFDAPVTEKIFVIDDGAYATMLLSDEY